MNDKHTFLWDYTRIQLKGLLELLAVAGSVALTVLVVWVLRYYGLGGNAPLYIGILLLLFLLVLLLIFCLSKRYTRPFQQIDRQLDALLADESSPIQLPRELASTGQKLGALQQAMERRLFSVQLAEQQKNDLVMYLAHGIRTPLTSVIGYLSLLDEARDVPQEQREKYTRITLDKACRLEKMINEFFEIARYSLQEIQLDRENIDLCYMLVQLTDKMLPVLARNGNKPVLRMESEDLWVYGDREKLARVFQNLLRNAAAYSYPDTDLVIRAGQRDGAVVLSFSNQGETIPPEKLPLVFDKFYRIDQASSSGFAGSGLGLAIAKEIVTLHGGTIRAESEDDTVTFLVTLPAGKDPGCA